MLKNRNTRVGYPLTMSLFFVKIDILDFCSVPPEQFTEAAICIAIISWLLSAKLIGRDAFLRPNSWTYEKS
jgi:hypothetical protein